ncbi:tetratricopeptide repeat protein [Croceicoccus sp. Ery5]|uniref:tetratricopeptide repeat protein n=1 Tax=Croceicoccus sp. Ery5 TaxID=1703340 RepID=UPI001E647627|nr:tetratricopeptide repeat protein [Croceicoccus sp. Ery5]
MALSPTSPENAVDKAAQRQRAQEDVFRREVDEAVRQDTISGFFRKWGKPLIAITVLALAALGGWSWWHHKTTSEAEADAVELTLAIDQLEAGNLAAAAEKAAGLTAEGTPAAYRVPAQFLAAAAAQEKGDNAQAVKLFDAVANDASNPQPFRDLAAIRAVAVDFDAMEPQKVIDRLKPLAVPGNPWFGSAGEMVGLAYVEQGKTELAGPLFAEIARDEDQPETLRARARQLAGLFGTDAVDDAQEIVEQIAAGGAAPN